MNLRIGEAFDPMAEKYDAFSPYIYGPNDRIYYIDPDGMDIIDYFWSTRYTGIDAQDKFRSLQMQYSLMHQYLFGPNPYSSFMGLQTAKEWELMGDILGATKVPGLAEVGDAISLASTIYQGD